MGGDVTVESRLGEGSVFRFELPIEAAGPPSPSARAPRRGTVVGIFGEGSPPRVLIVDDHEDNRTWLCKLLSQVGFDVREARDGVEALAVFDAWAPHVVLMDLHMPHLDGFAAMRAIRARPGGAATAVVAVTASAFDDTRDTIFEAGADGWLRKPCREGEILAEIARLTGVQYRYVTPYAQSLSPSRPMRAVRPDEGASLPAELCDAIVQAARIADHARLSELVDALPPEHARLPRSCGRSSRSMRTIRSCGGWSSKQAAWAARRDRRRSAGGTKQPPWPSLRQAVWRAAAAAVQRMPERGAVRLEGVDRSTRSVRDRPDAVNARRSRSTSRSIRLPVVDHDALSADRGRQGVELAGVEAVDVGVDEHRDRAQGGCHLDDSRGGRPSRAPARPSRRPRDSGQAGHLCTRRRSGRGAGGE